MCPVVGSQKVESQARIDRAVARLDAWLETMRGPSNQHGYGGPVAHWWQQSLLYTGPGYDWRYEGILQGYLVLWERTGQSQWLDRACRSANDLVNAQLPDGHYPNSAFELNPASGGTPHEAAADLGLLRLAKSLKKIGDHRWRIYFNCAEHNLRKYYLEQLWNPNEFSFRDHPAIASFVPNKAATACEAFFAWSELSGDSRWMDVYAMPTLKKILHHQVTETGALQGGIAQNSFGTKLVAKYMPYYVARCIPALIRGYQRFAEERFLAAALSAMGFVIRWLNPDGSLPAAVYAGGQVNQYPQWVAGLGDVLRIAELLRPYGFDPDLTEMEARLLAGQDSSGGFQTATGFSAHAGGRISNLPDLRDVLHVTGWADKAFRYLASRVSLGDLSGGQSRTFNAEVTFLDVRYELVETPHHLDFRRQGVTAYLWKKGESWAREASPDFWLH